MFKITTVTGVKEVEGTPYSIPELPAIEMFIHKDLNGRQYTISEVTTGKAMATENKLKEVKNKLLQIALNVGVDKINEIIKSNYTVEQFENTYNKYVVLRAEFENIFNFDMPKDYLCGGLDVIRLSDRLGISDLDISMKDYIGQKYGNRAVEVCKELMHIKGI